eukprot:317674-Hanusia_phi.AAC.1
MSVMQECRKALVSGGTGEAAIAVIRACMGYESSAGGGGAGKNLEIALKLVQNLSADEATGESLIEHGALEITLLCASSPDPKAGERGRSHGVEEDAGGGVEHEKRWTRRLKADQMTSVVRALRSGSVAAACRLSDVAVDAVARELASLIHQPGRAGSALGGCSSSQGGAGLSASKAAAYLYGQHDDSDDVGSLARPVSF